MERHAELQRVGVATGCNHVIRRRVGDDREGQVREARRERDRDGERQALVDRHGGAGRRDTTDGPTSGPCA
jgi:hypothetical protein